MTTTLPAEEALIPTLRAFARSRVERTSLRQVAREVGMSPSGLDKFLAGAMPYRKTRRKLEAWYTRGAAFDVDDEPSPETVAVAVRILAGLFPAAGRGRFVDDTLAQVGPVLPADSLWRGEFEGFGEYMRAGDVQ
jgi:hypothetical protein